MDEEKRRAIEACGNCGLPEAMHQYRTGEDAEAIGVLAALGGACERFAASEAALRYQRHLAIAARPPVKTGKRAPLCGRCGQRGHRAQDCPF